MKIKPRSCGCSPGRFDSRNLEGTMTANARRGARLSAGAWIRNSAGWIVPTVCIAAMPKCPVCVAAYVTLISGLGCSLMAAAYLRYALLTFSLISLTYLTTRAIRSWFVANEPVGDLTAR